jgi:hypothetical protein
VKVDFLRCKQITILCTIGYTISQPGKYKSRRPSFVKTGRYGFNAIIRMGTKSGANKINIDWCSKSVQALSIN